MRWTHFTGVVMFIQASFTLSINDFSNLLIDIKPDNILVNYSHDLARFSEVLVGDCGDTCMIEPDADPLEGHVIGAAIFRSPEAMLNLGWRAPTDIWSFGTMVSSTWSPRLQPHHNDRIIVNQSYMGR